jgi:nucleoside-diphosphate-sugar epimerase
MGGFMGVLVTGGAGFIGSHMVLELLDAGEDVLVIDNLSTGFRWAVPDEAKFVEGDVGDHAPAAAAQFRRRHPAFRRLHRRTGLDIRSATIPTIPASRVR